MTIIKPLGDRILVKLRREEEAVVGGVKLTLAHTDKKRYQPESAVFQVLAMGADVPAEVLSEGDFIVARSDAGVVLPPGTANGDNHRLYRMIEYPEVMSILEETKTVASPEQVLQEKVVI